MAEHKQYVTLRTNVRERHHSLNYHIQRDPSLFTGGLRDIITSKSKYRGNLFEYSRPFYRHRDVLGQQPGEYTIISEVDFQCYYY